MFHIVINKGLDKVQMRAVILETDTNWCKLKFTTAKCNLWVTTWN